MIEYLDAKDQPIDIDDIVLVTTPTDPAFKDQSALVVALGVEDNMEVIAIRYGYQNHAHLIHPSRVVYSGIRTGRGGHK